MKKMTVRALLPLLALSTATAAYGDYDETKDKSVEFSLDDGAGEAAFDYVDEVELARRQAELTKKQAEREKRLEGTLAQEERDEELRLRKELRSKKLADFQKREEHLQKLREADARRKGLARLDGLHHGLLERDALWAHRPAPQVPLIGHGIGPSLADNLSVLGAVKQPSYVLRPVEAPSFAPALGRMPASVPGMKGPFPYQEPAAKQKVAPSRTPQSSQTVTQRAGGVVQKAVQKLQGIWSSFKKLIGR